MFSISLEHLVLMLVLIVLIFSFRPPPSFWQRLHGDLRRLDHELAHRYPQWRRMPVFSAESIHHKEAEFIRDRMPRKVPYVRMGLVLLAIGVLLWWIAQQ